jgi:protein-S-isoprenylcysteine O-methyltransferase Ste14
MISTEPPKQKQPKKTTFLSPWVAYPLALIVWWVLPWAISLIAAQYGWLAGHPSVWNVLGLIPVLIGTIGMLWGVAVHSAQSPGGIEWELNKNYLLKRGIYAFSRHPMYLFELVLLFGWVVFCGSVALLIAFVIWFLFLNYYAVPREERILEAHFGEAYREYKEKVPRWLGKVRS